MPSQNKFDAQRPDPQSESFYEEIAAISPLAAHGSEQHRTIQPNRGV